MQLTNEQKECLRLYLVSQRELKKALKLVADARQAAWDLRDEVENNEFACMSVVAERYYTMPAASFGRLFHTNHLACLAAAETRIKLIKQYKKELSTDIPF